MATPINRPPVGFNELLQLQTKGQNPNMLSDQIVPTIDYENFIRNNIELRVKNVQFTFSDADNGTEVASFAVPDGDLWVVVNVSMHSTTNSAAAFRMALTMKTIGNPGSETYFASEQYDGSPLANVAVWHNFSPYLWFPSGNSFGVFCNDGGSATVRNGRLRIMHYRYKK